MYVAITRAKRYCMITFAGSRMRNGMTVTCRPSRFIGDISREYFRMLNGNDVSSDMFNPVERYRSSFHSAPPAAKSTSSWTGITRRPSAPSHSEPAPSDGALPTVHTADSLCEGMQIMHPKFGRGAIVEIDTTNIDPRIRVSFGGDDVKTLLLKFAKFTILND